MWLTRLALRNPVFILMMSLMICVLGYVSFTKLSVDLFPDISIPVVRVATFYTGAGPGDIEKSITEPIERAVSATPGVDRVESTSKQGASVISVWFNYGVNLDNAQFEVAQRVSQIVNTLPPGIQQPFNIKFDITNIPVASLAVSSDALDERQLYDLAYNTIEPQIERIQGVASANVSGGQTRQIQVKVNPDALRARNMAILDVVSAVRSTNLLLPSGNLKTGDRDYNVFSNTQVDDPKLLNDVILRAATATSTQPVRLSDVAVVEDGTADQSEIVRINGQRGVMLRVLKQPGANTIAVVDSLRKSLPTLRGIPSNVHLDISFDQSLYIRAAVSSLEHESLFGGLLAVAVILLFLANLRATGIISVAIPLSIIATFVLLFFAGQTLNVFTLGGLALGVGRLVDDSIVELENIHRHFEIEPDRSKAVLAAAQEVAAPIFVSTVTTIVVFFPVLFLVGVQQKLFLPLAMTIAFALIMSFLVSRTVTPLMCLYMLKSAVGHQKKGIEKWITTALTGLDNAYARALAVVLRHRAVTIIGILALFAASLTLGKKLATEFFPESDESQFSISFRTPLGTRVERTEQVAARMEDIIKRTLTLPGKNGPEPIYSVLYSSSGLPQGRGGLFGGNTGPHAGVVSVNLLPRARRPISDIEAAERVRKEIKDAFPGTQVFFYTGGIVKRILNMGSSAPIDLEILGYDLQEGAALAKELAARLNKLLDDDGKPLLTDVQISREEDYPQFDVSVDRQKAGVLGLNETQIAQSVLATMVGNTQFAPVQFTDPRTGNEYYINVRVDDKFRSRVSDLGDVLLRSPGGSIVTLDTVAKVVRSSGPVLVSRKYLQRIIDVTANVAPGKDLGRATAGVQKVIDDTKIPEGFTVGVGGQSAAQKEAFSGLLFAVLMALGLVYMVLASQFRSLLDPLVIMFSVPLGITGVFVMLYLTGTSLSVNSFMGIIMMVGIVVSNGVLLIDFANQLRARGMGLHEATVEAGRTRLRPILMTTIATLVGLAPMALGMGEGSETNLPLARAVIGGLTVSTFFTLFLVPALYTVLERFSKRKHFHGEGDLGGPSEGQVDHA
ncbi:MAG: efflux RND transporter permease subunit [Deltaproteobacteria bacterium]|nr:efflux RND transporter permease subunit [Deltaproteobacteria bacterium]